MRPLIVGASFLFAGALCVASCAALPGSIGGTDHAPQFDFSEFYVATAGKTFRVVLEGNPFLALTQRESQQRL